MPAHRQRCTLMQPACDVVVRGRMPLDGIANVARWRQSPCRLTRPVTCLRDAKPGQFFARRPLLACRCSPAARLLDTPIVSPYVGVVRCALGRIAVACLLSQLAVVSSAHAALWAGAADQWRECQCVHGDHAVCPMHHTPSPDSKRCVWRSAGDHSDVVLASLVGVLGFSQQSLQAVVPGPDSRFARPASESLVARFTPPDSPPPRL